MKNPDLVTDADGEWFEVYNNTGYAVNLTGLGVGDATGALFTVDDDLIVSASAYVVFAADSDPDNNGGVTTVDWDYPAADLPLSNGDGTIILYNGTTKIDTVTYDNGVTFPDPTGASMALKNSKLSATSNDTGSNWCYVHLVDRRGDRQRPGHPRGEERLLTRRRLGYLDRTEITYGSEYSTTK